MFIGSKSHLKISENCYRDFRGEIKLVNVIEKYEELLYREREKFTFFAYLSIFFLGAGRGLSLQHGALFTPEFSRKASLKPSKSIQSLFGNVKRFENLSWFCG